MKLKLRFERLTDVFAWIGRICVLLAVWGIIAGVAHFVVMPLVVRKGREVKVPDLRNHLLSDARTLFEKQGFRIVVDDERFDAEAPSGMILDQSPYPGGLTKKGRRIHVAVSAGPPTTLVPDVLGMTRDDALFTLERARLKAGEIQYAFSKTIYEGKVIGQGPAAGDTVPRGDEAVITVSLGVKPFNYIAPKVTGLPESQARFLILKAGLRVGEVLYDRYVRYKDGIVVVQKPDPGTVLKAGTQIELIVNSR